MYNLLGFWLSETVPDEITGVDASEVSEGYIDDILSDAFGTFRTCVGFVLVTEFLTSTEVSAVKEAVTMGSGVTNGSFLIAGVTSVSEEAYVEAVVTILGCPTVVSAFVIAIGVGADIRRHGLGGLGAGKHIGIWEAVDRGGGWA